MTSTGFSLGFGDNQKPSSKVLRPPGGGSSDIFGAENAGTPRTVRNHMASNIFGSTQDAPVKNNVRQGMHRYYFIGDGVRRGGKNGDSYNRLFGESDRPFTPAKNHLKSNIPLGGDSPAKINNGNNAATNGHTNGKAENNNGVQQNGTSKTGFRRRIKVEANPSGESNQTQSSQNPEAHPQTSPDSDNNTNASSNIDNNNESSANENSQSEVGEQGKVTSNETGVSEATDKLSITASNNNAADTTNDSITSPKQANNNREINGNDGGGSDIDKSYKNGDSSSTTTSSVTSPVSAISTDTTDQSNKSVASSGSSLRSPRGQTGSRNPVTGVGIEMPSYKRTRVLRRDGNPVTGEGYNGSGGAEVNTAVPSLNGAKQVINKNRIPPGGYSSGLW
ncbi:microtubule-associated protein Jupiter isoform X2 [Hermetia illucens]|uniref:microtubule-associated protein Jupiter isoform X2 n=1 Tax=Hermetia illucens TaxID=343691 RepID=UPI0018CBF6F0|nr:microtubule-associated protein Jupiter isoform X2 [Hermetia illucens]